MRWPFIVLCMLVLLFMTAGCGNKKDESVKAPDNVPIKWMNAGIQKNEKWEYKMLVHTSDVKDVLDKNQGAQNKDVVKHYQLNRWKKDDDTFYYQAIYKNPENGKPQKEFMKIVRTNDGWKRNDYYGPPNYHRLVSGLKKREVSK